MEHLDLHVLLQGEIVATVEATEEQIFEVGRQLDKKYGDMRRKLDIEQAQLGIHYQSWREFYERHRKLGP